MLRAKLVDGITQRFQALVYFEVGDRLALHALHDLRLNEARPPLQNSSF